MMELKFDTSGTYVIQVQGQLNETWSDRLGGMVIQVIPASENHPPITTLHGELMDQAALLGVLTTLYHLHLPVLSVEYLAKEPEEELHHNHTPIT